VGHAGAAAATGAAIGDNLKAGSDQRMPGVLHEDAYWGDDASDLLIALTTSPRGLSSAEAAERLERHGPNAVEEQRDVAAVRLLLHQFASPLVLILVFGAAISLFVRDWIDSAIVLAIVLGSTLLGFSQEYRASVAVAELRKRLALTVRVLRDGAVRTVVASQIVPGDVIELSAGNLVPADGVILTARDFLVTEASLTGESMPVEKQPGAVNAEVPMSGRTNCAFMGTSVRSGTSASPAPERMTQCRWRCSTMARVWLRTSCRRCRGASRAAGGRRQEAPDSGWRLSPRWHGGWGRNSFCAVRRKIVPTDSKRAWCGERQRSEPMQLRTTRYG
jgi:magnesium-transporting ATPase (P-type)